MTVCTCGRKDLMRPAQFDGQLILFCSSDQFGSFPAPTKICRDRLPRPQFARGHLIFADDRWTATDRKVLDIRKLIS